MDYLILLLFFCIILFLVVLGIIIPIFKKHNKVANGIINYNSTMRKFVYKINLSKQEIIELLNKKNYIDELSCEFFSEKSVIRFFENGSHRDYYFQIQEFDSFSILRLEQIELIGMQSHIPYKLNPFLVKKLKVEIIPFSKYSF